MVEQSADLEEYQQLVTDALKGAGVANKAPSQSGCALSFCPRNWPP